METVLHHQPLRAAVPEGGPWVTLHLPNGLYVRLSQRAARGSLENLQQAIGRLERSSEKSGTVLRLPAPRRRMLALCLQRLSLPMRARKGAALTLLATVLLLPLVLMVAALPLVTVLAAGAHVALVPALIGTSLVAMFVSLACARKLIGARRRRARRKRPTLRIVV